MYRRNSIMGSASPRRAATQREIKVASENKKNRQNSHLKPRRNITLDIRLRINSFDNRLPRKESLNKENNNNNNNEHPVFAASSLHRRISHATIK